MLAQELQSSASNSRIHASKLKHAQNECISLSRYFFKMVMLVFLKIKSN